MNCLFWTYFECFWLFFIFSYCYNAFVYLFIPFMHLDFLWLLTMSGRHFHLTTLMKSLSSFLVIGLWFLHAGHINITSEIAFLEGNNIKSSLFFHVYFQKKLSFSVRFRWWRVCDFHLKCAFCFCLVDMFSWFNTVYWLFQGLPTISNSTWMNLSPFLIYSLITIYFSYEWNTSWQLKGFNDQFYL